MAAFLDGADRVFGAGRMIRLDGLAMRAFQPAMARLGRDGGIDRGGLPVPAILGVDQAVARLAVVGVDDMADRTARMAIIARLVVRPHEQDRKSKRMNFSN